MQTINPNKALSQPDAPQKIRAIALSDVPPGSVTLADLKKVEVTNSLSEVMEPVRLSYLLVRVKFRHTNQVQEAITVKGLALLTNTEPSALLLWQQLVEPEILQPKEVLTLEANVFAPLED